MSESNPEHESGQASRENGDLGFTDKLHELLPGVKFEEPPEMHQARIAVLEALSIPRQDTELLRFIWTEYASICEQIIDSKTLHDAHPQLRAQFQIAALVHKALIFREVGNLQRYGEDLSDAEEYAFAVHLETIAEAIGRELDTLTAEKEEEL